MSWKGQYTCTDEGRMEVLISLPAIIYNIYIYKYILYFIIYIIYYILYTNAALEHPCTTSTCLVLKELRSKSYSLFVVVMMVVESIMFVFSHSLQVIFPTKEQVS